MSASMERIVVLARDLASTSGAQKKLAAGAERLAEIFQRAGGELQGILEDFSLMDGLTDESAAVADLLLAWREVGEVGVVFATRMLILGDTLQNSINNLELERVQRLQEAERLHRIYKESAAQAELAASQPQPRSWLRWRSGKDPAQEGLSQKQGRQEAMTLCLEHVEEHMSLALDQGRSILSAALVDARRFARVVGEKLLDLRSSWKGPAASVRSGAGSPNLKRLVENDTVIEDNYFERSIEAAGSALASSSGAKALMGGGSQDQAATRAVEGDLASELASRPSGVKIPRLSLPLSNPEIDTAPVPQLDADVTPCRSSGSSEEERTPAVFHEEEGAPRHPTAASGAEESALALESPVAASATASVVNASHTSTDVSTDIISEPCCSGVASDTMVAANEIARQAESSDQIIASAETTFDLSVEAFHTEEMPRTSTSEAFHTEEMPAEVDLPNDDCAEEFANQPAVFRSSAAAEATSMDTDLDASAFAERTAGGLADDAERCEAQLAAPSAPHSADVSHPAETSPRKVAAEEVDDLAFDGQADEDPPHWELACTPCSAEAVVVDVQTSELVGEVRTEVRPEPASVRTGEMSSGASNSCAADMDAQSIADVQPKETAWVDAPVVGTDTEVNASTAAVDDASPLWLALLAAASDDMDGSYVEHGDSIGAGSQCKDVVSSGSHAAASPQSTTLWRALEEAAALACDQSAAELS